jgi:hypothetical protein
MQQRLLIDQLIRRSLLFSEAASRNLPPITDAERAAFLSTSPVLSPLVKMDPASLTTHLNTIHQASPNDLSALIDESLTAQHLTQHLLNSLTDEDLWRIYQAQNTKITIDLIRLLNVPSPSELSRLVREQPAQITQYYETHRNLFQSPALAHVWTLTHTIPPDASPLDIEKIRNNLEALRQRARYEDLPTLARSYSDDPLTAPLGGRLPPLAQPQMPEAFTATIGQPSDILRRRNQLYFFVVTSIDPPQDRPLDPGLQREIASTLLRKQGPSLSAQSAALDILNAWKQNPSPPPDLLKKHAAESLPTATLSPSSPRLPNVGPLPAVLAAALTLTPENPFPSAPILDGDSFYIIHLRDLQKPSRTRFNAELPLFRQHTHTQLAPSILPKHLASRVPSDVQINLRPLTALFGTLQRDGSVLKSPPITSP